MKKAVIQKDTIIVGGGIAGLYAGHRLSSGHDFLILEKDREVGGRIHTYHDAVLGHVEAGAGRFHAGHKRLGKLLNELDLDHLIVPISSAESDYYPRHSQGVSYPSSTTSRLIDKVLREAEKETDERLQNTSFSEYASGVLTTKQLQHILDSFGYYVELRKMNLLSFKHLYEQHYSVTHFFALRGGLSQVVQKLKTRLRKHIHTSTQVLSIRYSAKDRKVVVETNNHTYECAQCICALPVEALRQLSFFSSISHKLRHIEAFPLCRIYSKYNPDNNDSPVWFQTLRKSTSNNLLRYIIPIDRERGVIMSSYSDSSFANRWRHLYQEKGLPGVKREISRLTYEAFGIRTAQPTHTKLFYWPHGVGYWLVGANSHRLSRELLQPYGQVPVYICGEHISDHNQQWIEGALETVERVLRK